MTSKKWSKGCFEMDHGSSQNRVKGPYFPPHNLPHPLICERGMLTKHNKLIQTGQTWVKYPFKSLFCSQVLSWHVTSTAVYCWLVTYPGSGPPAHHSLMNTFPRWKQKNMFSKRKYLQIQIQILVFLKYWQIYWTIEIFVRVNLLSIKILRIIDWNTGKSILSLFHIKNYWFECFCQWKLTSYCTRILVEPLVLILFGCFTSTNSF